MKVAKLCPPRGEGERLQLQTWGRCRGHALSGAGGGAIRSGADEQQVQQSAPSVMLKPAGAVLLS